MGGFVQVGFSTLTSGLPVIRPEQAEGSSFLVAIAQAWRALAKILESTRAPAVPSGLLLMNS